MADPQIEHLLRRAGFGARPDELALYGGMSTKQAVNALVDFDSVPDVVDSLISQPGYIGMTISGAFSPQANINHARQRWLFRMVHSDRPLQEKMTLFWHNHFATAFSKVNGSIGATDATRAMAAKPTDDASKVRGQIELFRDFAVGNFRDLLVNVAKDVAVRENCSEHQHPGDDARAAHRLRRKHAVSGAECLADQRARDAVCNGVHN